MKFRILALAAMLAVACSAVALADTKTLKGSFDGRGGKVTIKIETDGKGNALKVTSFAVKNAPSFCYDAEENRLTAGPPISGTFKGSFKITKFTTSAGTDYSFSGDKKLKGVVHNVSGTLATRKGRKVTGNIINSRASQTACSIVDEDYTAKR